jgi:DNA-binding PadR family transcriptional regulator
VRRRFEDRQHRNEDDAEFAGGDHVHGRGHRHRPGPPWGRFDGPPPWAGPRMKRGDIRTVLLIALLDGPAHGYELIQRMSERSGGRWKPSPGSVYPGLQALEDEGLVRSSDVDGKKVYALTDTGQTEATSRAARSDGPSWAGADGSPDARLRSAVFQLFGAVRQASHSLAPEQLAEVEALITETRRKIYELLARA